jgi:hypothetical protein
MKKTIYIVFSILLSTLLLTGCGNKTEENNNNNTDNSVNKEDITHDTKVSNLSESYTKYTTLKSDIMYKIIKTATDSGDFTLTMSMLPFSTFDLAFIPASICGLDEAAANAGLAFVYSNVKYEKDDDKCTVTYSSDEEEGKFVSDYDPKTDSATMSTYVDDKLSLVSEYAKINKGYISQVYSVNDNGTYSVYKVRFEGENIITGIFDEITSEPNSIFKVGKNIGVEFVEGANTLIELVDGKTTVTVDGEVLELK